MSGEAVSDGRAPDPTLERRITRPPGVPGWFDGHRLVASASTAEGIGVVVATEVSIHPDQELMSFRAAVVVAGSNPVVLAESEIAVPARGWELRGPGIWADHIVETPFRHWSYGLEAFALAIDDPDELLGRGLGERVPLGWELEFESRTDPVAPPVPGTPAGRYAQVGEVNGLVLLADRHLEISGGAVRVHRWGPPVPERDRVGAVGSTGRPLALPGPDGVWSVLARPGVGCTATREPRSPDRA